MNEPLPHQLTVGKLRYALADVPEEVVVVLVVPGGGIGHPDLLTLHDLTVRACGPVVELEPRRVGPDEARRA